MSCTINWESLEKSTSMVRRPDLAKNVCSLIPEFFTNASEGGDYPHPNLTVIFEDSFSNWTVKQLDLAEATKLYDRKELALILHSVPELSTVVTELTLRQLLAVGHSVWLTGTNNYTDLDTHLPALIDLLALLFS